MSKKNKIKFKNQNANKKINYNWIVVITISTFFIAVILGYFSLIFMEKVNIIGALVILFVIILVGIFFDMLGIAVTAANETPFHSMAASKITGAKESILIIRNASSFANFFNDVVGDIAGIISGSASAAIIVKMAVDNNIEVYVSVILGGIIAACTVGGKALGKELAMRNANFIVYKLGKIISVILLPKNNKGIGK